MSRLFPAPVCTAAEESRLFRQHFIDGKPFTREEAKTWRAIHERSLATLRRVAAELDDATPLSSPTTTSISSLSLP